MKSLLRAIGAFIYSAIVSAAFTALAVYLLTSVIAAEGFWKTLIYTVLMALFLFWLSERGVQYTSIPYNWLWDRTLKTRIATAIPAVIAFLWCVTSPFFISKTFTAGDWIVTAVWWLLCILLYFNLFMQSFVSTHMGVDEP